MPQTTLAQARAGYQVLALSVTSWGIVAWASVPVAVKELESKRRNCRLSYERRRRKSRLHRSAECSRFRSRALDSVPRKLDVRTRRGKCVPVGLTGQDR